MKKIIRKSFIFLMMLMMFPLSAFLTSCGATPAEEALGVFFVSNKYDAETGKAIFEVDLNSPEELTYQCNPSTTAAIIDFTIPVEGQTTSLNRFYYVFNKGVVTATDSRFEQIEIKITVGKYSDQCIVRLKEYPLEIYPAQNEVVINAYGSHTICAKGRFADGSIRTLLEEDYNFTVVSDNESVISVPNSSRLTVCSERSTASSATVTVTINDNKGESKGLTFKVKITVVEIAKSGFLKIDNFGKFVDSGDTVEVDANVLELNHLGEYELKYTAYFESVMGTIIKSEHGFVGSSNNNACVSFDNDNQIIKVKSDNDVVIEVSIWTGLFKEDGSVLKITFNIDYKAKV